VLIALGGIALLASDFGVRVRSGARDRSRVELELVLQPECSAQARVPPRRDVRREARGVGSLVLTAGPVAVLLSASHHRLGGRVLISL
jgi:hypothetical protein